jgi:hypothetical protein
LNHRDQCGDDEQNRNQNGKSAFKAHRKRL